MTHAPILTALLMLMACDPRGPLPGGKLDGRVATPPADWSFSDDTENVQLETRPSKPYSVNIWGVGVGSSFYVAAGGGGEASWAQHIGDDPRVRLRVDDTLYELQAIRVEAEPERERFLEALQAKYDWEPEPGQTEEAWLFRLEPR
jgi:hypothetical protein